MCHDLDQPAPADRLEGAPDLIRKWSVAVPLLISSPLAQPIRKTSRTPGSASH